MSQSMLSRDRAPADYSIAVLDRALDVLEALAEAPAGAALGVTEVARRIGATKSAAFRVLSNLERRGYIDKDPVTAKYTLGTRLAYLGERSLGALELRGAARPMLEELHRRFGETVNLGVRDGTEIVYVDMIESGHGLRMAARIGSRDALHSTALGKAILAFLSPATCDDLIGSGLPARTERTITDPAKLRAALECVRERGFAEDRDENEVGARCVGAPIFDHRGAVVGAISVSAPHSRLDDNRAADVAVAVSAGAAAVTQRLGGSSPNKQTDSSQSQPSDRRNPLIPNPAPPRALPPPEPPPARGRSLHRRGESPLGAGRREPVPDRAGKPPSPVLDGRGGLGGEG